MTAKQGGEPVRHYFMQKIVENECKTLMSIDLELRSRGLLVTEGLRHIYQWYRKMIETSQVIFE